MVSMLMMLASRSFAQSINMTVNDVKIKAGGTADLVVSLENSMTICAWQLYLNLPEGITPLYDENEEDWAITLSSRHKKKHQVKFEQTTDGDWMLVVTAGLDVVDINGNSGELCTISLKADNTFTGKHAAYVKTIRVSESDSKTTGQDDVSFTIEADTETGITSINSDQTAEVYDLKGNKVGITGNKTSNLPKGVYITKGKKVVVK